MDEKSSAPEPLTGDAGLNSGPLNRLINWTSPWPVVVALERSYGSNPPDPFLLERSLQPWTISALGLGRVKTI
jgi:hypothetical protein